MRILDGWAEYFYESNKKSYFTGLLEVPPTEDKTRKTRSRWFGSYTKEARRYNNKENWLFKNYRHFNIRFM